MVDVLGKLAKKDSSLQELTEDNGSSRPVTPLGAAQLGANEDQQKMVGTPAEKAGRAKQAVRADEQLTTTKAKGVTPTYELGESDIAPELEKLSQARGFVEVVRNSIQTTLENINTESFLTDAGKLSPIKDLLVRLHQGETEFSDEDEQRLVEHFGDGAFIQDIDGNFYLSESGQARFEQLFKSVPDEVLTYQDLTVGKLPADQVETIKSILGDKYSEDMTVDEVLSEISASIPDNQDIIKFNKILQDKNARADDKSYARRQLVKLGYLGKREEQEKINDIRPQIQPLR